MIPDPALTSDAFGRFLRGNAAERATALPLIDAALLAPVVALTAKDKSARVRAVAATLTPTAGSPPPPGSPEASLIVRLLSPQQTDRDGAFAELATTPDLPARVLPHLPGAPADLRFESLLLHLLASPTLRPLAAHTVGRLRLAPLADALSPFCGDLPLADFYDLCRRNARHGVA